MCAPLFLGTPAVGATAATSGLFGIGGGFGFLQAASTLGTVFNAYTKYQESQSLQRRYDYIAGIYEHDRIVNENAAKMEKARALHRADLQDERLANIISKQNTLFAKGGVVINTQSPLKVNDREAMNQLSDRMSLIHQGEMGAYKFGSQAASSEYTKKGYAGLGSQASTSGITGAGTALGKVGLTHVKRFGPLRIT